MQPHDTTAASPGLGNPSDLPAGNGQTVSTPPAEKPLASVTPLEVGGRHGAAPAPTAPTTNPSLGPVFESISAGTKLPDFDLQMVAEKAERTTAVELTPTADLNRASLQALQLRRIRDYEMKSLQASNPLKAVLGAVNAGLMRLSGPLQEGLEAFLAAGPLTPDRLARLAPIFDFHLRLTRQIQRFAQPELRPGCRTAKTPSREAAPSNKRNPPR